MDNQDRNLPNIYIIKHTEMKKQKIKRIIKESYQKYTRIEIYESLDRKGLLSMSCNK